MPLSIPNTTLQDDYTEATTFAGIDVLATGWFVVANNPAAITLLVNQGGYKHGMSSPFPEQYLAPGTYPLSPGAKLAVAGIKARNYIAGKPVQFFGAMYYPGEPYIASGQEYSGIVAPGGGVVPSSTGIFYDIQNIGTGSSYLDIQTQGVGPRNTVNFSNIGQLYEDTQSSGIIFWLNNGGFGGQPEIGLYGGDWIGYLDGGNDVVYTQEGDFIRYTGGGDAIFYTGQGGPSPSQVGDFLVYTVSGDGFTAGNIEFHLEAFNDATAGGYLQVSDGNGNPVFFIDQSAGVSRVGFFNVGPVAQQATPVTLGNVISLLQAYGLSA